MNPLASIPTTTVIPITLYRSINKATVSLKTFGRSSTVVMSLNAIPGFGKRGTTRIVQKALEDEDPQDPPALHLPPQLTHFRCFSPPSPNLYLLQSKIPVRKGRSLTRERSHVETGNRE